MMSRTNRVRSAMAGLALLAAPATLLAQTQSFQLPPGDLAAALDVYIRQTGTQLIYRVDQVKGVQTPGVTGNYSPDEALAHLLNGTSLVVARDSSGAIAIAPAAGETPAGSADPNVAAVPATAAAVGTETAAPEAGAATTVEAAKRGGIEEIIVTARKREESAQDVPISITALSAEDMKAFGIRNFADMEGVVPGLNLGGGGNGVKKDSSPFIRGIGQRETRVTLDPAVGTYIDGIYIGRAAGAMLDVATVESVEVLRGPQGTLFGRNSTGGAISVTTKKPGKTWAANLGTNVGNYGRQDVTFSMDAPLVADTLLSRLTLASINSNGYFTNAVDNTVWNDDNRFSGIAQLRWLPTDSINVDFLGERTRIRETPRPQRCKFIREPGFESLQTEQLNNIRSDGNFGGPDRLPTFEESCRMSEALPQDQFLSDASENDPIMPKARYEVDTTTLGATATWDAGDAGMFSDLQLKSITAWRRTEQIADEDLDAVDAPFIIRIQPRADQTDQISQELQLTGKAFDDRLFFSTGLYYFGEETPLSELILSAGIADVIAPFLGPDTYGAILFEPTRERLVTDNKAYAWFGQLDFDLTPTMQLTAGLRYTEEERFSRYTKAGALPSGVLAGNVIFGAFIQNAGYFIAAHDEPGINPVLSWRFGNCVSPSGLPSCNLDESSNEANFVEGLYVGEGLTQKDEAWTPMASLKYKADAEVLDRLNLNHLLAYATYSEGFHSGGVTAGAVDRNKNGTAEPVAFKPEYVTNYELGLKLAALDRRLQANLAVFYMDYTDMQVTATANRVGIPIPFIENVGKSTIQGVEAEFMLQPTAEWRVVANLGWTDADIKEWNSMQVDISNGVFGDPVISFLDRSDEPLPRVPEWQAYLMTDYAFALKGGSTLTPSIAVRYTSEIYHGFDRDSYCFTYGGVCNRGDTRKPADPPNDAVIVPQPGTRNAVTSEKVAFLDGRVSWVSADTRMEVALWGKNLTDIDDYLVGGIPLTGVNGATGQVYANPRTFGLTMAYNFGAN